MKIRPAGLVDFVVVIALVTVLLVQLGGYASDPGVGWHLMTGEKIATSGEVPRADFMLATPEPLAWVSDQWLADLFFFKVYEFGGWLWVYAVGVLIFLLTYFAVLYRCVAKHSGALLASAIGVLLAFKLGQIHLVLRPVLLSFPLFAAVYSIAQNWYHKDEPDKSFWLESILLMALFVLWCNLHPSFVLGLVVLGCLILALAARGLSGKGSAGWTKYTSIILLISVVSSLLTLINPYGLNLHLSILELGKSEYFMSHHMEWLSPNFKDPSGQFFEFILGFLFIGLVLTKQGRRAFSWLDFLLVAVFCHAALQAIRMLPHAGIVCALPLARMCLAFADEIRTTELPVIRLLPESFRKLELREAQSYRGMLGLILSIGLLFGNVILAERLPFAKFEPGPSPKKYPLSVIESLREKLPDGEVHPVVATPNWGGAITFYGRGKLKPIIDDRNTLLGEAYYKEFYAAFKEPARLAEYLKKVGAEYLMISNNTTQSSLLECSEQFELLVKGKRVSAWKLTG